MKANIILLFTFLLLVFSCTHTPSVIEPIPVYKCYEKSDNYLIADTNNRIITPLYVDSGPVVIDPNDMPERKYDYFSPCFNPNNSDEICFLRKNNMTMSLSMDLCTFNFCTGEVHKLSGDAYDYPQWGKKNYIVFTATDGQLWTIKSNGDSLKQLTNIGLNYYASWNPNGDKILFQRQTTAVITSQAVTTNMQGTILDTFPELNFSLINHWLTENTVLRSTPHRIDIYNMINENKELILATQIGNIGIYTKENINNVYWSNTSHLCKINKSTSKIDTLAVSGDNGRYSFFCVSETEKKLIVSRRNRRFLSGLILSYDALYLINTDGTESKQINIPE